MAKLTWHGPGEKIYRRGIQDVALFVFDPTAGNYGEGVAWNGITAVNENPTGADPTDLWADNGKYASFRSKEEYGCTIEAYTYPDPEWLPCDGIVLTAAGVRISGQTRSKFGLVYRTEIGNDMTENAGYEIHVAYGLTASPSSKDNTTINDSPEANNPSWECTSVPVPVSTMPGVRDTSLVVISSMDHTPAQMQALEDMLYGSTTDPATLLLPDEIDALLT